MINRPILEVRGLSIVRDGESILRGVNWRVTRGEHWVILGPNGSGKTSLLAALTGYLMPTEGEIRFLGKTYGEVDWRELRKRVGLVSSSIRQMMAEEEPALWTVASGRHAMIDYWGRPSRTEERKARRLLRWIDCGYLADRRWAVLSQGERQRVLIGRALMASPRVLILDEPCAGLDPVARDKFLEFVDALGRRPGSPTLLFVTHHVDEIMPAFGHVLCLRGGTVAAQGRVADIVTGRVLGEVFGAPVRIGRSGGRYQMRVQLRRLR